MARQNYKENIPYRESDINSKADYLINTVIR